ncbi:MAG: hypothetical protein HY840_04900 [Bacteroidetes bacterium]|nr:hypothetical protein [Bacteroidota bacterium]
MKIVYIYLCLLLSPLISFGQKDSANLLPKRNTIYIEAFGQGLLNSLSYDRLYRTNKIIKTSVSAGLTVVPSIGVGDFYFGSQISYNVLFAKKNHHLELGVGLNFLIETMTEGVEYLGESGDEKNYYSYFTPKLGYRFQRPQRGIFFRLAFTPLVAFMNRVGEISVGNAQVVNSRYEFFTNVVSFGNRAFPWGGISVGYTF